MFKGVKKYEARSVISQAFRKSRSHLVEKVCECIRGRFDDLESVDAMKGSRLLDVNTWPTETTDLEMFGDLEIKLLIGHFKAILEKNGVSIGTISTEWSAFKFYWQQALQGSTNVWPLLLTHHKDKFPNLGHLIEILHLFPISNAKVERGFSTMRRIKTD